MNPPKIICELDSSLASKWPQNLSLHQVDQLLIKGIFSQNLAITARAILKLKGNLLTAKAREKAQAAIESCISISRQSKIEETDMLNCLNFAGIEAEVLSKPNDSNSLQIHTFSISIGVKNVIQAIAIAGQQGYHSWVKRLPAALECYRRTKNSIMLIKPGDATVRMELRWRNNTETYNRFQPSDLDYDFCNLPRFLWPLYYIIRPIRMICQKAFGQSRAKQPWPFLGTPTSLISALFESVNLTSEDTLIDIGCGDGRVLIEAAKLHSCSGIGIEIDPKLAKIAKSKILKASLENKIKILIGNIDTFSIKEGTVVFIFLPISSIPSILHKLQKQLTSSFRVVVHEQDPLNPHLNPNDSTPIFTSTAITVRHTWNFS